MKYSIKTQLIATFFCLIALLLGINLLINNVFLEKFYIHQKQKNLIQIYDNINQYQDAADYQSDDFEYAFQQISGTSSVELTILWPDPSFEGAFVTVYQTRDNKLMRARVEGYLFGFTSEADKQDVLKKTDRYRIQRTTDSVAQMDYLELWGKLDNNCYLLMRIPILSITESVKISNRFSAYLMVAAIFLSIVMIWWISRKISAPIQELTQLSRRMANLEFDVKYTSGGSDEIGQLGKNFNEMSETLERAISELKTANNELQKDLEQKDQIDEMRKEFLSNVSHELKTPISLIQGYAEGLKECINDDEQSREFYCDVIMDEAGKMNNMVKKLLSLNQLEFGNDVVSIQRFDITELLNGVIQSASILAEQKEAKIIFEQKSPVHVWGDEFKVEEVITNYLSNAFNHVSGEKRIEVGMEEIGDKTRIYVFNTGLPIPEEDLDRVWIKFYKVDKARTREYGGSGIGLSIVKAIMDSMHQKFGVENCPDGVRFWFELDSAK